MRQLKSIRISVGFLIIFLVSICITTSAVAHAPGVSLSGFGTPTIDGVLSSGEWDTAASVDLQINLPPRHGSGTVPGKLFIMNDQTNLYLAVEYDFPSNDPIAIEFSFDNDHGGGEFYSNGDDGVDFVVGTEDPNNPLPFPFFGFIDRFRTDASPCPLPLIGCFFRDIENGGTADGGGAFSEQSGKTMVEMFHPLDSINDTQDFSLNVGDTIGFVLQVKFSNTIFPNPTTRTFFPPQTSTNPSPNEAGHIVIAGTLEIPIDIKPESCPNSLNVKSKGMLPVAILGTADFDVEMVDLASIRLEGIAPIRSSLEDVATPFDSSIEEVCTEVGPDGFTDLTLKFDTQEILGGLGDIEDRDVLILTLTGNLIDGTPIEGGDVVIFLKKGN